MTYIVLLSHYLNIAAHVSLFSNRVGNRGGPREGGREGESEVVKCPHTHATAAAAVAALFAPPPGRLREARSHVRAPDRDGKVFGAWYNRGSC